MKWILAIFLIAAVIIKENNAQSTPTDLDYVASVVEFNMNVAGATPQERLNVRVQNYNTLITAQATAGLVPDIIIFPEGTLTEVATPVTIPDPTQSIVMCENVNFNGHALQSISCAARTAARYVVINVIMNQVTGQVSTLFNTNVVFNRLGQVVSVYRKFNVFNEPTGVVAPPEPDIGTFTTSFGVTFGHIISRDIISQHPIQTMLSANVNNFIMTTRWQSTLPFLSGVQLQKNWAFARSVNLLASGSNNAGAGESGTGIYAGRQGALQSIVNAATATQTFVARITRAPGQNLNFNHQQHPITVPAITLARENLDYFGLHPLVPTTGVATQFCDYGFCCVFDYQLSDAGVLPNNVAYTYVAAVYSGLREGAVLSAGRISLCAVIACLDNQDRNTCGATFAPGQTVHNRFHFNRLTINGTFRGMPDASVMPTSVRPNLQPLQSTYILYNETPIRHENDRAYQDITMTLNLANEHLLTFGIYSRDFVSSATVPTIAILLVALSVLLNIFN